VWGHVVQGLVRADGVVLLSPALDDHFGLSPAPEPVEGEAFVAELAVEALVGAVLPGFAGGDVGGLDALIGEPGQDGPGDELGPVVGADVLRGAVQADETRQDVDDPSRADAAGDIDGERLARELVDHGQALELAAVGTGVVNEVVGPDVPGGA